MSMRMPRPSAAGKKCRSSSPIAHKTPSARTITRWCCSTTQAHIHCREWTSLRWRANSWRRFRPDCRREDELSLSPEMRDGSGYFMPFDPAFVVAQEVGSHRDLERTLVVI